MCSWSGMESRISFKNSLEEGEKGCGCARTGLALVVGGQNGSCSAHSCLCPKFYMIRSWKSVVTYSTQWMHSSSWLSDLFSQATGSHWLYQLSWEVTHQLNLCKQNLYQVCFQDMSLKVLSWLFGDFMLITQSTWVSTIDLSLQKVKASKPSNPFPTHLSFLCQKQEIFSCEFRQIWLVA